MHRFNMIQKPLSDPVPTRFFLDKDSSKVVSLQPCKSKDAPIFFVYINFRTQKLFTDFCRMTFPIVSWNKAVGIQVPMNPQLYNLFHIFQT